MRLLILPSLAGLATAAVLAGCLVFVRVRRRLRVAKLRRLVTGELEEQALPAQLLGLWRRRITRERRRRELEATLSGTLTELSELLRAGLGLLQTLETAHASARGIWRELWGRVLQRYRTGQSLGSALASLEEEGVPVLSLFVRACAIHGCHGGDLASACLLLAEDQRERLLLRREALAKSAEARFTARFLAAVPLVMGIYMLIAAPGMVRTLVVEPAGRLALVYAAASWGVGSWLVGRLLRVLRVDW